jgi:hypothetical protein
MAHVPRFPGAHPVSLDATLRVIEVQMRELDCSIVLGQPPRACECVLPPGYDGPEVEPPAFVPIAVVEAPLEDGHSVLAAWREGGVVDYDLQRSAPSTN